MYDHSSEILTMLDITCQKLGSEYVYASVMQVTPPADAMNSWGVPNPDDLADWHIPSVCGWAADYVRDM